MPNFAVAACIYSWQFAAVPLQLLETIMLKYKSDRRTVAYMAVTTVLLPLQWTLGEFNPILFILSLFMAVSVAVMAHNHNHVPMWKSKKLNILTDYWLTLFYGFPAFGWIPTHNRNHHALNNKAGDYTITYRLSEANNMGTLLTYPSISSYHQQKPIRDYLKRQWEINRENFYLCIFQYVALALWYIGAFSLDWNPVYSDSPSLLSTLWTWAGAVFSSKALLYVVIPHQVALFFIMVFNYVQHVHADEESDYNHSRNFVGPMLNLFLFNNGFHTIHHQRANIHWSETPSAHAQIDHLIDDVLKEPSFWGYMFRTYVFAIFSKKYSFSSMRLRRMERETVAATVERA